MYISITDQINATNQRINYRQLKYAQSATYYAEYLQLTMVTNTDKYQVAYSVHLIR